MAKITVSPQVPVSRPFPPDETGETYVKVRPPRFEEELERGRLRSKHTFTFDESGFPVRQVDINLNHLWAMEIWLTYEETNMEVETSRQATQPEIEAGKANENGMVTETITFKPRSQTTMPEFLLKLSRLPPALVYHWHSIVIDVVRAWADPFA